MKSAAIIHLLRSGKVEAMVVGVVGAEEQVRAEAKIARRLIEASDDERQTMYGPAYDAIWGMHLGRNPDVLEFGAVDWLLPMLDRLTGPGDRVLEVGCGAGMLSIQLAKRSRQVTGVEVSDVALQKCRERDTDDTVNWRLVQGIGLPFDDGSFDFCFSVEVFEHLHERDARAHLAEIRRVLRRGGRYWFLTPSALKSAGAAERFRVAVQPDADTHLKEWTYREIRPALRDAGFTKARMPFRDHRPRLPLLPVSVFAAAERLPVRVRPLALDRVSVVAS